MTEEEITEGEVNHGFHGFKTEAAARAHLSRACVARGWILARFIVKPEDFVAEGGDDESEVNVVYYKMTMDEIIDSEHFGKCGGAKRAACGRFARKSS